MPFIDSKITVALSEEKKECLKAELGQAVSILNKPESFLMVGFEDNYDLYMGGKKLDKGAYVAVSLFGNAPSSAYEKMTAVRPGLNDLYSGIVMRLERTAVHPRYAVIGFGKF